MFKNGYNLNLKTTIIFSISFFSILGLLSQCVSNHYEKVSSGVKFSEYHPRKLAEYQSCEECDDPVLKHYQESSEKERLKWEKEKKERERKQKELDEYNEKVKAELEQLRKETEELKKWINENAECDVKDEGSEENKSEDTKNEDEK